MNYTDFCQKNIDLSPLGLEMKGDFIPYFCTPQGAKIFGGLGVDGIHFCFIEGFGETVFSVSPMNFSGDYVRPVAKSFEDLLRLLVSCGDMSAIEQAGQMDETGFYRFLEQNPWDSAQENLVKRLEQELSLSFIENPFAYIRALQREFDSTKIPFTEEYYQTVGDGNAAGKPDEEWQVCYSGGNSCTEEIAVDRSFLWGDERIVVPSVYLCQEGLVLDLCAEVPFQKLKDYLQKVALYQYDEEAIPPKLRQRLERENPFSFSIRASLTANGQTVNECTSSCLCYIPQPLLFGEASNSAKVCSVVGHYALDENSGWALYRISFPFAGKPPLKSLSLTLRAAPAIVEGACFSSPSVGDSFSFVHPLTQAPYCLTVTGYEQQTLDFSNLPQKDCYFPNCRTKMTYSVFPSLPKGALFIRDCLENDAVQPVETAFGADNTAASIGIIGGADGPIAIFVADNQNEEQQTAFSALHFQPAKEIEWQLFFKEKGRADIEIKLI